MGLDLKATVPPPFLSVFESIAVKDYDAPHYRCGVALNWLSTHGFINQTGGDVQPVTMTDKGKLLAKELGVIGIGPGLKAVQ